MNSLLTGALAALLALAPIGSAAAQETSSFRVGGMVYRVPVPDGYCLPEGVELEIAQLTAAADSANVTHLSLFRCPSPEGPRTDYILIKTPIAALMARVTREQLLDGLGAAFSAGPLTSALNSGELLSEIENRLSTVVGSSVDLAGELRPLGRDDVCAYLGGTVRVSSPAANYSISLATCITAISDRVVSINWYGPDRGSEGVAALLMNARGLAERISAQPAD